MMKDNWYLQSKRSRPNMQSGLYNLLIERKKLSLGRAIELIEEYRESKFLKSRRTLLDHLRNGNNFAIFLSFISNATGIKFKKRPQRRSSYETWWETSNLDGSFAYNGVTDDF